MTLGERGKSSRGMRAVLAVVAWIGIGAGLAGCAAKSAPVAASRPAAEAGTAEANLQPGPGVNLGRDTTLGLNQPNQGTQPYFSVGVDDRGGKQRALLYFDVAQAGLPAGAVVTSAVLTLHADGRFCSGPASALHLYPATREWKENEADWELAAAKLSWERPGGDYASTVPAAGAWADDLKRPAVRVDFYLDPGLVQGWLNGQPNRGLLLKADEEFGGANLISFYSRQYPQNPEWRPRLKLIYRP